LGRKSDPESVTVRCSAQPSVPHQPNDDAADQHRDQTHNAQSAVRHIESGGGRALSAEREGGKQDTLDREEQADRSKKSDMHALN
jgi:hypothetical protein